MWSFKNFTLGTMAKIFNLRISSFLGMWQAFCKQFISVVVVMTLLHVDLTFDPNGGFGSCSLRKENILILNVEKLQKRYMKNGFLRYNSPFYLPQWGTCTSDNVTQCDEGCKPNVRLTPFGKCEHPTTNNDCLSSHHKPFTRGTSPTFLILRDKCEFKRASTRAHFAALAQTLPSFTTEENIFTGRPTPKPPPKSPPRDFEATLRETFATFTYLRLSWKSKFDVAKVRINYKEEDNSIHNIEIPVNLTGRYTSNVYSKTDPRKGFNYKLTGLTRRRRYFVQFSAYLVESQKVLHNSLSYISGDQDTDDRLYNLNGIFMVLGISTIIMAVVLVCVGYEKFLHEKKNNIINFLLCRRKKKKPPSEPLPNGSISPEPLMVPRRSQVVPMDQDTSSLSSREYERW